MSLHKTSAQNLNITKHLLANGIVARSEYGVIAINRDSMCQAEFTKSLNEQDCYDFIIMFIQEYLNNDYKVLWSSRNDNEMFLTVYQDIVV